MSVVRVGDHVGKRCAAGLIVVGERIAGARALAHAEGSPTVPLSDIGLLTHLRQAAQKNMTTTIAETITAGDTIASSMTLTTTTSSATTTMTTTNY